MELEFSPRLRALLQACVVTFLWSSSWVLIKTALVEIPPLTFAGLRYTLAFVVLLPGLYNHRTEIRALSATDWWHLIVLGVIFYTFTQGGQFLTLHHLQAVTFSLLLNFTTIVVALIGIGVLKERLSTLQWGGIFTFLVGVLIYFLPLSIPKGQAIGFLLAGFTVCANSAASILGRSINRERTTSPLVVTGISMGIGALILLGSGVVVQGLPAISVKGWLIIGILALVNTAFAFTLWNKTLQSLSAVESSIINNTMLVQIALLAWIFLGETISTREVIGLILAMTGIVMAQLKKPIS